MACKRESEKTMAKNGQYFKALFDLTKRANAITFCGKDSEFNDTEICLFSEIIKAKHRGERLISTRLADLLGVTRSAISQMVNRLEANGMVHRVADDVDRKIAYVEITEEALETYGDDLKICVDFVGRVVDKFGVERFNNMCTAFEEFCKLAEVEQADFVAKRKYTK